MKRSRIVYSFLLLAIVGLGLLSRTGLVPRLIYPYLGDYLYAIMWFIIVALVFTKKEALTVALISLSICYLIEFSQLSQAAWLSTIRSYKIGGLILGYGFLWSDMISYALGIITAYFLDKRNSHLLTEFKK